MFTPILLNALIYIRWVKNLEKYCCSVDVTTMHIPHMFPWTRISNGSNENQCFEFLGAYSLSISYDLELILVNYELNTSQSSKSYLAGT